ncbi:MAG: carbohydrate kinase family protein [Pseudolysinimonas sp.]
MSSSRVLVVGDANPDLVLRGDVVPRFGQVEQLLDGAHLVLGGSAGIAASGLARLGVPTWLVAVVGDDLFGREVLAALAAAGVSTEQVIVRAGEATGLSVHLSAPGDRAILTLPGTIPLLSADMVRAAIAEVAPSWVHVASPFLTPALTADLPALLAECRAAGIGTSLDTNWDPSGQWRGIAEALPYVDVLLPNRAEVDALGGEQAIVALGPRAVVKDGAEGGWSLDASGARVSAPGIPSEVVDTTGAGDSFDAGYLAAIASGITDEAVRLRWATVAGSLSTRAAGGTAGQATLDELRAAL